MGVVKQRWIPRRLLKQQSTLAVNKPISRSKGDYFRKLDKRTEFFLTLSLGVSIIIWYTLSYISYGDSLEVSVELPTTSTFADVLGDREEAQIDDDLGVYQEEELLVGYDDNTDDHHEIFEDDLMFMNHPQDFKPGIAWLMSYPNSGTSFTMTLAFEDSNTTVATNYVKEVKNLNMPINPLYKNSTLPVLLRPDMNLPSHYILTKTHCRGTCVECGPRKYITSLSSFTNQCASSHGQDPYEVNLVKKAVHITRDPIDNIVSNFRLKYEQKKEKKDVNWLSVFTKDIKGFRRWCNAIDDRFVKQEKNRDIIPREISKHFDGVPCHGLFYKYVTWHNGAHGVTRDLDLPTLYIWYEDYADDFQRTKKRLFDFLELENMSSLVEFESGKSYQNYFSRKERKRIYRMIERLATPEARKSVERYLQ